MAESCGHCGREGTLVHLNDVVIDKKDIEIVHGSGAGG
jgi:hypothetical protein